MRQKGFAPILIILIVLVVVGGAYYLGTQKANIFPTSTQPSPMVATSTPTQLTPTIQPTANLNTLSWTTKEWYVAGNSEEFPIPSATYSIEYPNTWSYSNNSDTAKNCFKIVISDSTKIITINIDNICTGWGQVKDKTILPKEYKLVKKTTEVLDGTQNYIYLVRINKADGNYTYIEGTNSKDDLQSAFFTNAIMIQENTAVKDTHSYFTASNIVVKYSGNSEIREKYLEVADKIIASLNIKSVN